MLDRSLQSEPDQTHVTAEQSSAELFRAVSSLGRRGADDERGALNHLTPERVTAAARLVARGGSRSRCLSWPLNTTAAPDNPQPAEHRMTAWGDHEPR